MRGEVFQQIGEGVAGDEIFECVAHMTSRALGKMKITMVGVLIFASMRFWSLSVIMLWSLNLKVDVSFKWIC